MIFFLRLVILSRHHGESGAAGPKSPLYTHDRAQHNTAQNKKSFLTHTPQSREPRVHEKERGSFGHTHIGT